MSAPALLAEVWRGSVLETVVRGHVVVVDADGRLLAHAGDPQAPLPVRSAVKPLQALAYLRSGAHATLGAGTDELALACASHNGEPVHVAVARRLLGRAGLGEDALLCGAHAPYGGEAARALVAAGEEPRRIHNNCSGKHAAMLAACVVAGWPLDDYTGRDHPLQHAVDAALAEHCGVEVTAASPWGIDGCGLPTHGMALAALARGFARAAASDEGFRSCQAAMAEHPHLVGGTGRFDTALLAVAGDRLTAKSGGAACWVAVGRAPGAPAVAVKLEGAPGEHLPPIALAALRAAGLFDVDSDAPRDGAADAALDCFARPRLRTWEGVVAGGTRLRLSLETR